MTYFIKNIYCSIGELYCDKCKQSYMVFQDSELSQKMLSHTVSLSSLTDEIKNFENMHRNCKEYHE